MEKELWLRSKVVYGKTSIMHEVRNGETCWKIADVFSTTVEHLKRLNTGLDCDNLQNVNATCVPWVQVDSDLPGTEDDLVISMSLWKINLIILFGSGRCPGHIITTLRRSLSKT